MKKTGIIAGLLCLLILFAFGIAYWLVNTKLTPEAIANITRDATGNPVIIKTSPEVSFFPPEVSFGEATWQHDGHGGKWEATIEKTEIVFFFWPLLTGSVKIKNISLENPQLVFTLHSKQESAESADKTQPVTSGIDDLQKIEITRISAQQGSIICKDGDQAISMRDINFLAENLAGKEESLLKSDCTLEIKNGDQEIAKGNLAFKSLLSYSASNLALRNTAITFTDITDNPEALTIPLRFVFDGALNLSDMTLQISNGSMPILPGSIHTSGTLNLALGTYAGKLEMEGEVASLSPLPLKPEPASPIWHIRSDVKMESRKLAIENMAILLGSCSGKGDLIAAFDSQKRIQLSGSIDLDKLNLANFFPDEVTLESEGSAVKARHRLESASKSNYFWPGLDLRVNIREIVYKKCEIDNASFHLIGKEGKYAANDLGFMWAEGQVKGRLETDLLKKDFHLEMGGSDINLGKALSETGINGIQAGKSAFVFSIGASIDSESILATAYGRGQLQGSGATIPALKSLAHMLPIPGGKKFIFPDQVDSISARWAINKGIAAIKPVSLKAGSLDIQGEAIANLPSARLDGKADIHLLDINLPITFKGPYSDLSWNMGSGFFNELKKLIP